MGFFHDEYGNLRLLNATLAGMLALTGSCYFLGNVANDWEVSKGERTGMINKLSRKGYLWGTYEGQMALEGIASSGGSIGANVWDFSIDEQRRHSEDRDNLVKRLKEFMNSGVKAKVGYIEAAATWPWRSETHYLIQTVEPIKPITEGYGRTTNSERKNSTPSELVPGAIEVNIDGRTYILRHDNEGKLRVNEIRGVQ